MCAPRPPNLLHLYVPKNRISKYFNLLKSHLSPPFWYLRQLPIDVQCLNFLVIGLAPKECLHWQTLSKLIYTLSLVQTIKKSIFSKTLEPHHHTSHHQGSRKWDPRDTAGQHKSYLVKQNETWVLGLHSLFIPGKGTQFGQTVLWIGQKIWQSKTGIKKQNTNFSFWVWSQKNIWIFCCVFAQI